MEQNEKLSPSMEDYLEAILTIVKKKRAARAKDIVNQVHVKASSVTGALRLLSEKGLVNYTPYDLITLTDEGEAVAEDIARRHETLRNFLTSILRVDAEDADDSACKLEHAISPDIVKRLMLFVDFVQQCPRVGSAWIKEFEGYCQRGSIRDGCEGCLQSCLDDYQKKTLRKAVSTH